jgi:hypothetical protein
MSDYVAWTSKQFHTFLHTHTQKKKLKITYFNQHACFTVMLNGVPDMNQLSAFAPSSCCSYWDATDQVVMILYFHSINIFLDAFPYEKSKWVQIRRMWRPEDKAS